MTSFHPVRIAELECAHRPVTIIASPDTVSAALDAVGLSGDVRKTADLLKEEHSSFTLYRTEGEICTRATVIILPETQSSHMPKQNVFALKSQLKDSYYSEESAVFVVALADSSVEAHEGIIAEILRGKPEYSRKTLNLREAASVIDIAVVQNLSDDEMNRLRAIAEILPDVIRLVDTPTLEMTTEDLAAEARHEAKRLGIEMIEIAGEDLASQGFGGLYHVGKSGVTPPRLVVLKYRTSSPRRHIALVGKGIVYDTGGLCLKSRDHMATMKSDMGGAAAVFGAVRAAAMTHLDCNVTGLMCIAENGIGPNALRPDDVITMHSGLTVEINNTDAEGRLVLADGVSYASRVLKPDVIIDMATLTGAQLMCTGKRHAGLLTPSDAFGKAIFDAARACGEPVFPMLYAPEILFDEFSSDVADMKNSCKDRMNAQSSCAGHFVEKHISPEYKGEYAHIDIAGPAWNGERATGFGMILLDAICRLP